jgi:hypothetical protein
MVALVTVTTTAAGVLSYGNLEEALLPRSLDRTETHSRLIAADLESYVGGARADIAIFSSLAESNGLMRARLNGGIDPSITFPRRIGAIVSACVWSQSWEPSLPIRYFVSSASMMAGVKSFGSIVPDRTVRFESFRTKNCSERASGLISRIPSV